jgi:hypothetical protein
MLTVNTKESVHAPPATSVVNAGPEVVKVSKSSLTSQTSAIQKFVQ